MSDDTQAQPVAQDAAPMVPPVEVQAPAAAPVADAAQPAANPPAAAPPVPKTFTQRFQEMEKAVFQQQYVIQFHSNVMKDLIKELQEAKEAVDGVRKVLSATMKLAEEGTVATQVAIADKITQLQAEGYKATVDKDLKENRIRVIDAIKDNRDLVVFQSLEVLYGYNLVEQFPDENVRKEMMGKKVGDTVGGMTILGLYEEVPAPAAQPTTGDANAPQAQDPAQQPQ